MENHASSGTDDRNFLWGVSSSAFQIEGYIENDMTEWERGGYFKQNGKDPKYLNAVNHWNLWKNDFQLLKALGINSYRLSFEWSRIEPEPGHFDEKALDKYERMIDRLIEMNIRPMLTLHHFTHPLWFHTETPWTEETAIQSFIRFAEKILQKIGHKITHFITLNEPVVWALAAYGDARFPPGEKNLEKMADVLKNMLLAHREVFHLIKKYNSGAKVGIADNFIIFKPSREWNLLDRGISYLIHRFYNLGLLDAFHRNRLNVVFPFLIHFREELELQDAIDFWGINYYYRMHVRFRLNWKQPMELQFLNRSGEGLSDMGWENYSHGLWQVMTWVKNTGKPFIITENGIADRQDRQRVKFLEKHLKIVQKALDSGFPIEGYFHWSLMDNYEWLEGRSAKFGLYAVDDQDGMKRKLRTSGRFYSDYIKKHRAI
ncbi:MAG: glycoside hydrolase family 1 protein [Calditrichaeota bacterium]|nr:glycoside hydrolase family 1 protein [Calditrichota bacterium]RQW08240.1 MAG: glycoside hydrolase family 1 protein [Calditrichota bacterium]